MMIRQVSAAKSQGLNATTITSPRKNNLIIHKLHQEWCTSKWVLACMSSLWPHNSSKNHINHLGLSYETVDTWTYGLKYSNRYLKYTKETKTWAHLWWNQLKNFLRKPLSSIRTSKYILPVNLRHEFNLKNEESSHFGVLWRDGWISLVVKLRWNSPQWAT